MLRTAGGRRIEWEHQAKDLRVPKQGLSGSSVELVGFGQSVGGNTTNFQTKPAWYLRL